MMHVGHYRVCRSHRSERWGSRRSPRQNHDRRRRRHTIYRVPVAKINILMAADRSQSRAMHFDIATSPSRGAAATHCAWPSVLGVSKSILTTPMHHGTLAAKDPRVVLARRHMAGFGGECWPSVALLHHCCTTKHRRHLRWVLQGARNIHLRCSHASSEVCGPAGVFREVYLVCECGAVA
jgi:hypothetical protein